MTQSKPIQGRPLPIELLYEMYQFMPLNGLIKCCQASLTLSALGIPRARKVQAKLISLYFEDIFMLVIWFKQWARQVAEVRTKICLQIFNRFTFDQIWFTLLINDLDQFRNLLLEFRDKITAILLADQARNILAGFNFPLAFRNELRQIRASHIEKTLAPAKLELSQLHLMIPNWNEMLTCFRAILKEDFYFILLQQQFIHAAIRVELCHDQFKMAVKHLNRRN